MRGVSASLTSAVMADCFWVPVTTWRRHGQYEAYMLVLATDVLHYFSHWPFLLASCKSESRASLSWNAQLLAQVGRQSFCHAALINLRCNKTRFSPRANS
jgi:hypothetical protein